MELGTGSGKGKTTRSDWGRCGEKSTVTSIYVTYPRESALKRDDSWWLILNWITRTVASDNPIHLRICCLMRDTRAPNAPCELIKMPNEQDRQVLFWSVRLFTLASLQFLTANLIVYTQQNMPPCNRIGCTRSWRCTLIEWITDKFSLIDRW